MLGIRSVSGSVLWIRNDFFRIRIRILLVLWLRIQHELFLIFVTFLPLYSPLINVSGSIGIVTRGYKLFKDFFIKRNLCF
jgi:hypothetical protein